MSLIVIKQQYERTQNATILWFNFSLNIIVLRVLTYAHIVSVHDPMGEPYSRPASDHGRRFLTHLGEHCDISVFSWTQAYIRGFLYLSQKK